MRLLALEVGTGERKEGADDPSLGKEGLDYEGKVPPQSNRKECEHFQLSASGPGTDT